MKGYKLILTEKPSVAKDFAKALNAKPQKGYYITSDKKYVIVFAYGHLLTIDNSSIAPSRWEWKTLPIIPERFSYTLIDDSGVKKQFNLIKRLLKDTEEVIVATDAGREGELIARLILQYAGWKGPAYRIWTSEALSKEVILRELNNLKPLSQFDSVFHEALARQHADWLVGINLSRATTLKKINGQKNRDTRKDRNVGNKKRKEVWSVGRVQTPVLSMVVKRFLERKNFKSQIYYVVQALLSHQNTEFKASLKLPEGDEKEEDRKNGKNGENRESKGLKKEEAEEIVKYLSDADTGIVSAVKHSQKKELPPLLHSLTSLQREANKLYGFSAQKTLNIAQKLYEVYKALSYPRTDATHLDETTQTRNLVKRVLSMLGYKHLIPAVDRAGKRVFDSSKLTDHYALIPLRPLPQEATKDERLIYNLVLRKFVGAFMDPYVYEIFNLEIKIKDKLFVASLRKDIQSGWKELYQKEKEPQKEQKAESEFSIQENDQVKVNKIEYVQRKTQPPAPYTEGTLLKQMERLGLGTPATRSIILETLKKRNYLITKGKILEPTPKGLELIEFYNNKEISSPEMTAEWEKRLEKIRKKEEKYQSFIESIKEFVKLQIKQINHSDNLSSTTADTPADPAP